MTHILVIEDESDVRDLIALHLKREGYQVTAFDNAEDGLNAILKQKFDLAILDWMLPQMSGLDLCKILRTKHNVQFPVLLLTARADTLDKVLGLEIGADDYLTKPFETREFIARVRALLRRPHRTEPQSELRAGDLRLNLQTHKTLIENNEVLLTPNEFKLLAELMKKPGHTFGREVLIELIQGPHVAVVDRTIDTTVLGLRKKLGKYADWVETVRGFGYRLKDTP